MRAHGLLVRTIACTIYARTWSLLAAAPVLHPYIKLAPWACGVSLCVGTRQCLTLMFPILQVFTHDNKRTSCSTAAVDSDGLLQASY